MEDNPAPKRERLLSQTLPLALLQRQGAGAWHKRFVLLLLPTPNLHLSQGKTTSLGLPLLCHSPRGAGGREVTAAGGQWVAVPAWALWV